MSFAPNLAGIMIIIPSLPSKMINKWLWQITYLYDQSLISMQVIKN